MQSLLFKISSSLVKPTRETLLEYCSYCLVVISVIGVARVWIGRAGLQNGCPLENFESPGEDFPTFDGFRTSPVLNDAAEHFQTATLRPTRKNSLDEQTVIMVQGHNDFYQPVTGIVDTVSAVKRMGLRKKVKAKFLHLPGIDEDQASGNLTWQRHEKCAKQYQSIFAYILLIESAILLFVGLLWTKIPKVSCVIDEFSKLIHSCEKSEWAKRALHLINEKGQDENLSQSLYSVISNDSAVYDIKSLLDTVFHPDGDYKTKACARHLYEKVQIFCDIHTRKTAIWTTYFIKSFLQFGLWIVVFNINLVLFVVLEFYILCPEDSPIPCDHDMFLRIVWFMAQMVLLIYVVFVCKTLRWINEKSIIRQWSCCNYFSCFKKHKTLYANDDGSSLTCRPYRFADNDPVYNDVALLLHLLEEAHPKVLPYFVVFMFPEWKEKLTSFANPVQICEIPMRSAMQMLSGRPPPIIEITDIPMNEDDEQPRHDTTQWTLPKKKSKNAVTFYIGNERGKADDDIKNSFSEEVSIKSNSPSQPSSFHISSVPKAKKKDQTSPKEGRKPLHHDKIGIESDHGRMRVEDANETTVLIHKSSSSDSMKSSDQGSNGTGTDSHQSSDVSETQSLLRHDDLEI